MKRARPGRKVPWLALGALLLWAGPLPAQDHIKLKDGTRIEGRATGYDEATRVLGLRSADGQDLRYPLDQLDQRSVYQVTRSTVAQDDGRGQLELGGYARDIGLYAHAARHYRYAEAADPSLAAEVARQRAVLRAEAAGYCMQNAREAVAGNDLEGAEKWLTTLVEQLPDEPLAEQAAGMLERYYTEVRAAREAPISQKNPEFLRTELADAKRYYDKSVESTRQGLTQPRAGSKSVRSFESAIKDGERALGELEKKTRGLTEPSRAETVSGYRGLAIDQVVEARLHLASHYMTRSSYKQALAQVNQALALAPGHPGASAMRARIEEASSRGLRWW